MGLWMEGLDGRTLRPTTAPTGDHEARRCITEYSNNGSVVFHECNFLDEWFRGSSDFDATLLLWIFCIGLVIAAICACIKIYTDTIERLEARSKYPSRMHWEQKLACDKKAMFERDQVLIQALVDYETGGGGSYSVRRGATNRLTLHSDGGKIDEHECSDCWICLYDHWGMGVEPINKEEPQDADATKVTPLLSSVKLDV